MSSINYNIYIYIYIAWHQYQHIHDIIITGVVKFLMREARNHFPPLTENTKYLKSQWFIKFPLICLDVLKYVGRRNPYFLYLKDSFSHPLYWPFDSAAWDDSITRPPPTQATPQISILCHRSVFLSAKSHENQFVCTATSSQNSGSLHWLQKSRTVFTQLTTQ